MHAEIPRDRCGRCKNGYTGGFQLPLKFIQPQLLGARRPRGERIPFPRASQNKRQQPEGGKARRGGGEAGCPADSTRLRRTDRAALRHSAQGRQRVNSAPCLLRALTSRGGGERCRPPPPPPRPGGVCACVRSGGGALQPGQPPRPPPGHGAPRSALFLFLRRLSSAAPLPELRAPGSGGRAAGGGCRAPPLESRHRRAALGGSSSSSNPRRALFICFAPSPPPALFFLF